MMSTTAIGLTAGNRLLGSSCFYSNTNEKLSCSSDIGFTFVFTKNVISAKKPSDYGHSPISNRVTNTIRVLKDPSSCTDQCVQTFNPLDKKGSQDELSVESLLLLQKSLLEKQWNISTKRNSTTATPTEKISKKVHVAGSQISARRRRLDARKKTTYTCSAKQGVASKQSRSTLGPELLQNQSKGYLKGVTSEVLLTHSEVVILSNKIKIGLRLEEQKLRLKKKMGTEPSEEQLATSTRISRTDLRTTQIITNLPILKKKLGTEPSEEQLATSMRISRTDLRTKQIECTLAREKLALSNVRLVMSIAQRYDNMGAQMADLIQGGLIGLLRGIEKYDSSRGYKISTYVYWWIRQGVSRALMENSRILRLPAHLHERQSAIRNAKIKLEEQGINPSIDRIAESLNISRKKVTNATQAITKVFSLDRGAFPSINGLYGQIFYSDIADTCMENNPWHGVDKKALKEEVNKLISITLGERERYIIRLYYGLDNECLIWEDIGKRMGLSREGVRKIGLVALEKLKNAAKKTRLETMLVEH